MSSFIFDILAHIIGYGQTSLTVHTALPADRVIDALRDRTQTPDSLADKLPPMRLKTPLGPKTINARPSVEDPDEPFVGTVSRDRIVLRLRIRPPNDDSQNFFSTTWNSFTPHFRGRVEPTDDGAIIRGSVTPHRLVLGCVALFCGISAAGLGYVTWLQLTSPDASLSIGFLILPLVLLAFVFIIARVGIHIGRRDIPRLKDHLSQLT
jgi:hypothetical protein